MKSNIVVSSVVLGFFFTSCIGLPVLTDEQQTLAGYVADAACVAAISNGEGLSQEGTQNMIDIYGKNITENFADSPAALYLQDEKKLQELTSSFEENPLLVGVFVQEFLTRVQERCGLEEGGDIQQIINMFGESAVLQ